MTVTSKSNLDSQNGKIIDDFPINNIDVGETSGKGKNGYFNSSLSLTLSESVDEMVRLSEARKKKDGLENDHKKEIEPAKKKKFTKEQIVVIFMLCYGNFCVACAYSILAPFFPKEVSLIKNYYQFSLLTLLMLFFINEFRLN